MKNCLPFCFTLTLLLFVFSCKTPPKPPVEEVELPSAQIVFDNIEALSPGEITLLFFLDLENPLPRPVTSFTGHPDFRLNDKDFPGEHYEANIPPEVLLAAEAGERTPFQISLSIDNFFSNGEDDFDEYTAEVLLPLRFVSQDGTESGETVRGVAVFPRIREPVFRITNIAVRQAELINTRLLVNLQINNPNPFPLKLSAFSYKLYGAGRFWADGKLQDVLNVPPRGTTNARLFLLMNFINMKRDLLDQVIEMTYVRYRFQGEALIGSDIEYLPSFPFLFDHSGDSPVVK